MTFQFFLKLLEIFPPNMAIIELKMNPIKAYRITFIALPELALFGYEAGSQTTNTGFASCTSIKALILCFSIVL